MPHQPSRLAPYLASQLTIVESASMQEYPYMLVWPSNLRCDADSNYYDHVTNSTYAGVEELLLPIAAMAVDPFQVQNLTQASAPN